MKKRAATILMAFLLALSFIPMIGAGSNAFAAEAQWLWPVPSSTTINQPWNAAHGGLDIGGAYGCAVVASKSGTVLKVIHGDIANYGGYGNGVVINHGDGYYSHYAHLSATSVNEGQYVSQGQVIGAMGDTGNATGTHLHFAIKTGGQGPYGGPSGAIDNNPGAVNYIYSTNNVPKGHVDEATGKAGAIYVRGWAFDPDAKSASLSVHVYIGGPAGSGEGHAIMADQSSTDVNNAYGISGNHRFATTIYTQKSGSQPYYVYAIDTAGGENPQIGSGTVYITADNAGPVISNVKYTNLTSTGYTVSCKVTDSGSGVSRVQFPTWTDKNGQDDLAGNWTSNSAVSGTKDGDTYTFRVNTSDHNNERGGYTTDIYAWDNSGNQCAKAERVKLTVPEPDTVKPVIKSLKIVSQSDTEAVIEAVLSDNVGINTSRGGFTVYNVLSEDRTPIANNQPKKITWVSDTTVRITVGQNFAEKQRLRVEVYDYEGNYSEPATIDYELAALKYVYLAPGETMSEADFTTYKVASEQAQAWRNRSWLGDILQDNENGTFTALKAGKCTLLYRRKSTGEEVGCTVVVRYPPHDHNWGEGVETKEATASEEGLMTYTCSICGETRTEVIPREVEVGEDGTAVGPGASAAAAETAIINMASDKDPKGAKFSTLTLRSTKQTKASISLKWTQADGAVKYVIYGNKCGSGNRPQKLAATGGNTMSFTKIRGARIRKGTYYKFIVVALDDNNKVVSTSKIIHVATKGGKVGNDKSVKISKTVLNNAQKLRAGKSLKLGAKAVPQSSKLKVRKHVALRYESTNKRVATVSSKGTIKAKKRGTCYVYAYAQDGVYRKVKVVVR